MQYTDKYIQNLSGSPHLLLRPAVFCCAVFSKSVVTCVSAHPCYLICEIATDVLIADWITDA